MAAEGPAAAAVQKDTKSKEKRGGNGEGLQCTDILSMPHPDEVEPCGLPGIR